MLRMYPMQNWFNLSDAGIEDAIYDGYAMCCFMYLDFLTEQVPDATTLLHFRYLIEKTGLVKRFLPMSKSGWSDDAQWNYCKRYHHCRPRLY